MGLMTPGLPPQPSGFEGLRPVFSEVGPPDGLAIAERPQVPYKSLNLSAAHPAASAEADQHEHLVACVDQLFDFQPRPIRPGRIEVAIEGAQFIGPTKDHGVYEPPRQIDYEIRWEHVPGFRVAAVDHRVDVPDELHVLLRHRLLRQPGGFEGLGALPEGLESDHPVAAKGPYVEVGELGDGAASGS